MPMEIFERKDVVKVVKKLPPELKRKYQFWKSVVFYQGVDGLKEIKGFRDHPLKGIWEGARACYLNESWRVIYRIEKNHEVLVFVERVSKHDYQ